MSVNLSPSFAAKQSVAFGSKKEKSSHSYVGSAVKGVVAGGVIGVGVAAATRKLAAMDVPVDTVTISSRLKKSAESLAGEKPVKKFALVGAIIGAIALVAKTVKNKKAEAAAEKLQPLS